MRHEDELVRPHVLDIRERARLQIVDTDHAMTTLKERIAEMRAEKAGTARDD